MNGISRVVVVTDSLDVDGGSGKVALGTARAIADCGIETTVFAASGSSDGDRPNLQFVTTGQGTFLTDSNPFAAAARGIYNVAARDGLLAILENCDPHHTIVHVHSWTKALSPSIFTAIEASGMPLVVTLHEYFLACPTGSLYLHNTAEICHLKPLGARCIATNCDSRNYAYKAYRVARQFVQRDLLRAPGPRATLVGVSEFSKRILTPLLEPASAIEVVRNPIATPRGPRVAAEANRSFVYVGRLSAEKGATLFAAAARAAGVEAVFIGAGEEHDAVARINPDARLVGWVDSERVGEYLRNARTIVMPSLWYETFGLVVLEGAALGVPSIVPAGTAPSDLVANGKTGSWFARGDVDDLARVLREHLDDGVVGNQSRNAYDAYWHEPATMEKHLAAIFDVYARARSRGATEVS